MSVFRKCPSQWDAWSWRLGRYRSRGVNSASGPATTTRLKMNPNKNSDQVLSNSLASPRAFGWREVEQLLVLELGQPEEFELSVLPTECSRKLPE